MEPKKQQVRTEYVGKGMEQLDSSSEKQTIYNKKYVLRHPESEDTSDFEKYIKDASKSEQFTDGEKKVIKDIQIEHKHKMQNMDSFLTKHYALLEYKINKCMLRCHDSQDNQQIRDCKQGCNKSVEKVSSFIQKKVDDVKSELIDCSLKCQSPMKDIVYENIICYDLFFKNLDKVKKEINVELSYYQ